MSGIPSARIIPKEIREVVSRVLRVPNVKPAVHPEKSDPTGLMEHDGMHIPRASGGKGP